MSTDDTTAAAPPPADPPAEPEAAPAEAPAAASTDLVPLTPPAPVAAVQADDATKLVAVDSQTAAGLDQKATQFVGELGSLDTHSAEFQTKLKAIYDMGSQDIRDASSVSNRLLDKPTKAMESGVFDSTSNVSTSLVQLRRTIEDLDPSRQGPFAKKRLWGLIPWFGNRIRDYFAKYQSAQSHLNAIIDSLLRGQDELQADNASIEQEKTNLWQTMANLRQYAYLAQKLDAALSAKIADVQTTDPDKAKTLQEDGLFYVRQKVQDLLTELAVSAQGYMALDMIRKNNLELIKGVDRATTTTVSALRTAVIVSQALADQKLVLDQITALNTTTSDMIETTSELLKDQSTKVHEEAVSSTIDVQKLQKAFDNIYAALDEIDTYKVAALDTMQKTVDALSAEITESQKHLERMHDEESGEAAAGTAATAAPAASSELSL
jgi:uncharacterized protein YaaN involved in tellurite resistance